ncbi:MAG: hypothetical protein U9O18_00610 [Chloroflexota bacterium]|nr:hypothetical protein [Chloroflexota bacterium]
MEMGFMVVVGVIVVIALIMVFITLSMRFAKPGERLVVYEKGRTTKRLMVGPVPPGQSRRGKGKLIIPFVRRSVRVKGDLVEAWDAVRDALPWDWEVERPSEGQSQGGRTVRAHGPHDAVVEATGPTEHDALMALAASLKERD